MVNGFNAPLVVIREYPPSRPHSDYYILSGHRRYTAARVVRLTKLPCVIESGSYYIEVEEGWYETNPECVRKLEMYNRQRDKTLDEMLRESIVKANPEDAYRVLTEHREQRADEFYVYTDGLIDLREEKARAKISNAKMPFVNTIIRIVNEMREYWPLSDRQIHYELLNDPPLRHASKPDSTYNNRPEKDEHGNEIKNNGKNCYKDLCDLLLRMRLEGMIPVACIDDETRPVSITSCHQHAGIFLQQEIAGLLKGYYRDLMQSQPNHVEIMYEKLTGYGFIKRISQQHCIPLTVGRGFSSFPPRQKIAERYRKSGRSKLIVLVMTDLDPDGDEIAHSFARSMRDDFSIANVELIKVALTMDQVKERKLPASDKDKAKKGSTNYPKYIEQYKTDNVWELEALSPAVQQEMLVNAIDSVLDIDAYNREVDEEKKEAVFLDEKRQRALLAFRE